MIDAERIEIDEQTAAALDAIALHHDESPLELAKLVQIDPSIFRKFIQDVGLAHDSDALEILEAAETVGKSESVESKVVHALTMSLPSFARKMSELLLSAQLRWVPQAGGHLDFDMQVPSVLPASCVLGNERFKIPGARQNMELACLTRGQDPVANGWIRVDGDEIVILPVPSDSEAWNAVVATPHGVEPIDCPQDRVVFLLKWINHPIRTNTPEVDLCLSGALLGAWQKGVERQLRNSELAAWLYILLTHSEALLNQAYSVALRNVSNRTAGFLFEDVEPGRVAGHIDSMRYSLWNRFQNNWN